MQRYRFCVIGLNAIVAVGTAHADPPPIKYSAFDLIDGRSFALSMLKDGEGVTDYGVAIGGAAARCTVKSTLPAAHNENRLVIPEDKSCPLFSSPTPMAFTVHAKVTGRAALDPLDKVGLAFEFNPGKPFSGGTRFDGTSLHVQPAYGAWPSTTMCFAYFSPHDNAWEQKEFALPAGSAELVAALPLSDTAGAVYAHYGACAATTDFTPINDVYRVDYPAVYTGKSPGGSWCSDYVKDRDDETDNDVRFKPVYGSESNYRICVDQANPLGEARIVENKIHYIRTFEFGKIIIRHWRNVVPVVTIAGAGVSINQPGFAGPSVTVVQSPTSAAPPAASTSAAGGFVLPASQDGQGISGETDGDALVSTVFIPPHAPGAMHIDIRFVDPGDATKSKAATAVDLAVDQGYAGSLRLGISHVFFGHDRSFSKLQRAANTPAEIIEKDIGGNEVVIGYSVYWDGLRHDPAGRTYAVVGNRFLRHMGFFVGFGLLNYSPGNIDFLRSFHLGVEVEVTRNISFAVTYVGRRVTQLDGNLRVGGPAPTGDIPTSSGYQSGLGLVLNFSTDFVKFAISTPSAGASK